MPERTYIQGSIQLTPKQWFFIEEEQKQRGLKSYSHTLRDLLDELIQRKQKAIDELTQRRQK